MSSTQDVIAPRDNWGSNDSLVPDVPALIALHPESCHCGPTDPIAQSSRDDCVRDDELYVAQRTPRGAGLNKFPPAQVVSSGLVLACFTNRHVRNRFDHPFEIRLTDRSDFRIGCWITKIDRHWDAVAHGELDCV